MTIGLSHGVRSCHSIMCLYQFRNARLFWRCRCFFFFVYHSRFMRVIFSQWFFFRILYFTVVINSLVCRTTFIDKRLSFYNKNSSCINRTTALFFKFQRPLQIYGLHSLVDLCMRNVEKCILSLQISNLQINWKQMFHSTHAVCTYTFISVLNQIQ